MKVSYVLIKKVQTEHFYRYKE